MPAFPAAVVELVAIDRQGQPAVAGLLLDDPARHVCMVTARMVEAAGFVPPWHAYLAHQNGRIVGACAFKAPPVNGAVEIGYFTFPQEENRGVGTAMVRGLLDIVRKTAPMLTVVARTRNQENASNTILRKLGFYFAGEHIDAEDGIAWSWHLSPAQREKILP